MSRRFAVAVALIAGLLGMHGFTSDHGSMPPLATDGTNAHAAPPAMAAEAAKTAEAGKPMATAMRWLAAGPARATGTASGVQAHNAATTPMSWLATGPAHATSTTAQTQPHHTTATPGTTLATGPAHAMGALCLAILTGLGWLLLTMLLRRRAREAVPVSGRFRAFARAAEPLPPSLSELCVLRT